MKLTKNKKYLQQKFSRNVLVPETAADFTPRVSKSYVPFICKFPMVMHLIFGADSSQVMQVKNQFLCFQLRQSLFKILCMFQIFPCSIHGELPKNPLSELCEKRNSLSVSMSNNLKVVQICEYRVLVYISIFSGGHLEISLEKGSYPP